MTKPPRLPRIRSVEDFPYELAADERELLGATIGGMEQYLAVAAASHGAGETERPGLPNSWAALLNDPVAGSKILDFSNYVVGQMPWSQRQDVRELSVLLINKRFHNEYAYRIHVEMAKSVGVSEDKIHSLDFFEDSDVFTDEERLVLRFTNAACDGRVADDLFEAARQSYGDKELFEFIVTIAFWSFFAVALNCIEPEPDAYP